MPPATGRIPEAEIHQAEVEKTIFKGEVVYSRN